MALLLPFESWAGNQTLDVSPVSSPATFDGKGMGNANAEARPAGA
jgi:hypothetical protein